MSQILIYGHKVSTNARAVFHMLDDQKVSYEVSQVDLLAGQQYSPEFMKLNPVCKVPFLKEINPSGTFTLSESVPIMRYLATKYCKNAYGKDLESCAKVDEMTSIFQTLLYPQLGFNLFYPQVFSTYHARATEQGQKDCLEFGATRAYTLLKTINDAFLNKGTTFLLGEKPMICDYYAFTIVTLGEIIGEYMDDFPNVGKWVKNMKDKTNYKGAYEVHASMVEANKSKTFTKLMKPK